MTCTLQQTASMYYGFFHLNITIMHFCSEQEMPPLLPVKGDGGRGVHEAAGARWDAVLLQRRLQYLRAWGMCGKDPIKLHDFDLVKVLLNRIVH